MKCTSGHETAIDARQKHRLRHAIILSSGERKLHPLTKGPTVLTCSTDLLGEVLGVLLALPAFAASAKTERSSRSL